MDILVGDKNTISKWPIHGYNKKDEIGHIEVYTREVTDTNHYMSFLVKEIYDEHLAGKSNYRKRLVYLTSLE